MISLRVKIEIYHAFLFIKIERERNRHLFLIFNSFEIIIIHFEFASTNDNFMISQGGKAVQRWQNVHDVS